MSQSLQGLCIHGPFAASTPPALTSQILLSVLFPTQNAGPARVSLACSINADRQQQRHSADTHPLLLTPRTARHLPSLAQSSISFCRGSLEPQIEDLINRIHELQQGKLQDLRRPAGSERGIGWGPPHSPVRSRPLDCLKVGLQHPSLQDTARLEATSHCRFVLSLAIEGEIQRGTGRSPSSLGGPASGPGLL